jgi:hypothetical protein
VHWQREAEADEGKSDFAMRCVASKLRVKVKERVMRIETAA